MMGAAVAFLCLGRCSVGAAEPIAKHVVVVGLDGCRPELLAEHSTGALKQLWQEGAYTWRAEAALPSVTQVNFAGIFTGCSPAKHGIDQVAWDHESSPKLKVKVTTLFEVLAQNALTGAAFLGHEKLYPAETEAAARAGIHFVHSPHAARGAATMAAKYLREHQPNFTFVYFGDLDGAGHTHGWMSPPQVATMAEINRGVEMVMAAIQETAMRGRTTVIVTADHGGHGKSHSQGTPEDCLVPWVVWGAGVSAGAIGQDAAIQNYDTAPTALRLLGVTPPGEWEGRVVREALLNIR